MKRLLLILSCVLCISSYSYSRDYQTSRVATLEKLEGKTATVKLKDSSVVTTINLINTLDYYLRTPLEADGSYVFIYDNVDNDIFNNVQNKSAISRVDEKLAKSMMNQDNYFVLFVVFLAIVAAVISLVSRRDLIIRIAVFIFFLGITLGTSKHIYQVKDPHHEWVDYGYIVHYDNNTDTCVIENEQGQKNCYAISKVVQTTCYQSDSILRDTVAKGAIIKSGSQYYLYKSLDKDEKIIEATIAYINNSIDSKVIIILLAFFSIWVISELLRIVIICEQMRKHSSRIVEFRQTKFAEEQDCQEELKLQHKMLEERGKIEEEILRQKEIRQQEVIRNCERYISDFWQDFLDGTESRKALLARLKFKLENSGYENWRKDFYADVEKKANEYQRPSQEQRQNSSAEETDFGNFGNLLIDFNGVFVTPVQYQILCQRSQGRKLSRAQVLELCHKLAETMAEFAYFKEVRDIQPYVEKEETNEAFRLFGLTSETLTVESLKQAYRRLVQKYHPDRNKEPNAVVMFQKVQRYYAYLEGLARS